MAEPILGEVLNYVWLFIQYVSWWLIPLFFLFRAKTVWSRYPIEVIILEKRGEGFIKSNDRAGKWEDPGTGHTVYRLLKSNDVIDVLPFDTILHNAIKDTNILEKLVNKLRLTIGTVHLLKYGSKQYKPIKVGSGVDGRMAEDEQGNILAVQEMKDSNGQTIYIKKVVPFDITEHLGVIDFQIIDWDDVNTTLNEIENSRVRRIAKWDTWAKFLLPLAILGVAAIVCIITIYLTYDAQLQFCNVAPVQVPAENPDIPKAEDQTLKIIGVPTES